MAQQTRIDQFYKSVSGNRRSDMKGAKKCVKAKNIQRQKNGGGKRNKKRNLQQFQSVTKSKTVLNSVMLDEVSMEYNEKEIEEIWNSENTLTSNNLNKEQEFVNDIDIDIENTSNKQLKISDKSNSSLSNLDNSISEVEMKDGTPDCPKSSQKKMLFENSINTEMITKAINNMNSANQKAIPLNNFNLCDIYSTNVFNYEYSGINSTISLKYRTDDIDLNDDLCSKILLFAIFKVFSNPVNCGYFDENELHFIYSIISLPRDPQMLLARIIKRKRCWFRISNIKYAEISDNLKPAFDILVSRHICTYSIEKENLYNILDLLQVEEIQEVCRRMKIAAKGTKKNKIEQLCKLSKVKPLFPGMKSPGTILNDILMEVLNYCVCITYETWDIIDKIITLLLPNQDPKSTMSDTFLLLGDIYLKKKMFPNISGQLFPVFCSKLHLQSYTYAKCTLSKILKDIEGKKWENVRHYGNLAIDVLPNILETDLNRQKYYALPIHVRRYMPGYVWLKILSLSIDGFKRDNNIQKVVEALNVLIKQNCHMHLNKGKWYSELALVEMHHLKNMERTVVVIMEALNIKHLTQVDKVNLLERAKKVLRRKAGAKPSIQTAMKKVLLDHDHQMPKYEARINIIDGKLMPRNNTGVKTVWYVEHASSEGKNYGTVEYLALHYYCEQGFPSGLHCEGSLPIMLFFTLLWEELYDTYIPGAFITYYQDAPNDLFTEEFYENRKEKIEMRLQIISDTFNSESLSSWMEEKFQICKQYQSLMTSSLQENIQMKEIVSCLGVHGVIGICRKLIENFKLWKAGFPDLFVWNFSTKECTLCKLLIKLLIMSTIPKHKIIEVKGPRDVLSTKQRLWLSYLCELGLNTEVCLVRDKSTVHQSLDTIGDHDDS